MHAESYNVEMKRVDKKSPERKERLKGPRFSNYTSLSVPQVKILEEALTVDLLHALRKKLTP